MMPTPGVLPTELLKAGLLPVSGFGPRIDMKMNFPSGEMSSKSGAGSLLIEPTRLNWSNDRVVSRIDDRHVVSKPFDHPEETLSIGSNRAVRVGIRSIVRVNKTRRRRVRRIRTQVAAQRKGVKVCFFGTTRIDVHLSVSLNTSAAVRMHDVLVILGYDRHRRGIRINDKQSTAR